MGSKIEAKGLIAGAGVPVLPILSELDNLTAADRPVLVKASAGGGGRGMRVVRTLDELPGQLDVARSEAASAFGDPTVFCEPYLEAGRHIEVQVLADAHGTVWAVGSGSARSSAGTRRSSRNHLLLWWSGLLACASPNPASGRSNSAPGHADAWVATPEQGGVAVVSLENQDRPLLTDCLEKCLEMPAVKGYVERQLVAADYVKNTILTAPKLDEVLADTGYPALLEDQANREVIRVEAASKFREGAANRYAIICVVSIFVAIVSLFLTLTILGPSRGQEFNPFLAFLVLPATGSVWFGGVQIGWMLWRQTPGQLAYLTRIMVFLVTFPAITLITSE